MAKNLVIVESPAKSKTLTKYLGKDFSVLASFGHVRDLLPKTGAVDPDNQFEMHYQAIDRSKQAVDAIKKAIRTADTLYLATDPDREGEAISWHVLALLKSARLLKNKTIHRIVFHEITKTAVLDAINQPRDLCMNLINAQQARRALDYLVGFNLSPLLWKKIRRGLSAGRVQSPALRLIVEREQEINDFVKQEYWSITAHLHAHEKDFSAKLQLFAGEKQQQFSICDENHAQQVKETLLKQANGKLIVSHVDKKTRKRQAAAPFITSSLQQDAVRKLGFSAQKTMRVAQQLYEGIQTQEGSIGLITYMRTDSVHLANEAITDLRDYITKNYQADYLPAKPNVYKTKAKNAQEAHEAIRPTAMKRTPESLQSALNPEQFKLYQLIWQRTLACQMVHATIDTVAVSLACGSGNNFKANGSTIKHPGFLIVYQQGSEEGQKENIENQLPPLDINEEVILKDIEDKQHFTEPPPRYSEANLIKALEEFGIGRPSTYASIISTLLNRDYVLLEKKRFIPSDIGVIVNRFLTRYFTQYIDYDFTAKLEDDLDAIARGENEYLPLLEKFWSPFKNQIDTIESSVKRSDVTQEKLDEDCPECGHHLTLRLGKSGLFIGCSAYPDCAYTRSTNENKEEVQPETLDKNCPECGQTLIIRHGRYGKFIGCSTYPDCRYIEPLQKPKETGISCPQCKEGEIFERMSRNKKVFYACNRYPKCNYALWYPPLNEACPDCQWPILMLKTTKRSGEEKICPQKDCHYKAKLSE